MSLFSKGDQYLNITIKLTVVTLLFYLYLPIFVPKKVSDVFLKFKDYN